MNLYKTKTAGLALLGLLLLGGSPAPVAFAQGGQDLNISYQRPPQTIADIIDAPATPSVSINSKGDLMLLLERPGYPSIEELAQPESRLAGLRINPATNGQSRASSISNIKVKQVNGGQESQIKGLPQNARLSYITWSPDEKYIAFTNTVANGIELWIADISTKQAKKLTNATVNDAHRGSPFEWTSDSKTLVVKFVDENRGEMPEPVLAPAGPTIQQNIGKVKPSRTYQDLLKNRYDEQLFDYYMQTQLKLVTVDGQQQTIGKAGVVKGFEVSPDGQYLLVEMIQKPYSYLVPSYNFPYSVEVWSRDGKVVKQLAQLPLAEDIPIAFDAVAKGPRNYSWRPDKAATLYWAEAQDGGDANKEVAVRDIVYTLDAPFAAKPTKLATTKYRYRGIQWGENLALVNERWWKTRAERVSSVDPAKPGKATVLIERSYEDGYNDPGSPVFTKNKFGRSVLLTDKKGQHIYMISEGGSPEGNRPFLSEFNLKSKKAKILFRSEAPYYERPVDIINLDKKQIITRRESEKDAPNYFVRDLGKKQLTQVTTFPHPTPQLEGVQKEMLQYERNDGVKLNAVLYLPKDYKKGDAPLPMLMWAYPREFKNAATAGQVKSSPYEFTRISSGSPLFWVTQGYAVLDRTDIPIVGEGNAQPNDTYNEQLVASAKAAIDKVVSMGVVDPKRVAVGGHSYGAFMTANLLAHSNLFAAGIARSGAYNRTLTPFGFQQEERSYWEAPEVYHRMSPFSFADKVKTPILLIHGEADNNSGTFPIQSERFYNALKGHGATTRLVFLPHESHGYAAKESILHMLWEMDTWLNTYVKHRPVQ
ncbi:S9 family peptidase [Pontibacter sp. BT310]|uniref:Prolyl oligopeptidase family serine peptidase n=1 Tax=Pontibacter populi TaxID=890055 RepID=A0ABS6X9A2_9BACT|nr:MULTISPECIES: prolyl oligopeptidase family serine peptidase [Pontibacter]MBJ6116813.1 S9 family peptidase [Pontibacter sp. BT310]MBR0569235.1 S9 family peptidase [Microvirga sp. STS03]MBW3363666.1 prolyl oligopeptidase family serine peptidase [Pontibacter populi]